MLIAEAAQTVTTLNQRVRADLILDGVLQPSDEVQLNDGSLAGVGDTIITCRNDRRLRSGRSWARNGGRWKITKVRNDGSITIRPATRKFGGAIVLPAAYVTDFVDLGYAVTAHRAQGITTDTAHTVATAQSTRENFYVAMTRGRQANQAYVAVDRPDGLHEQAHPSENPDATARSVLYGVLQHVGAELSAHETIASEHERWGSTAQLAAEYETTAQAAQQDRWATLIRDSGLTPEQADAALTSDAFEALMTELRRVEANHHDMVVLLPRLVRVRGFDDADDIVSVLHYRVARATARSAGSGRTRKGPQLIAGLIPVVNGLVAQDLRTGLDERQVLIKDRAEAVLDTALNAREEWVAQLGTPPTPVHDAWRSAARTVAAYRDRYGIVGPSRSEHQPNMTHRESMLRGRMPQLIGRAGRPPAIALSTESPFAPTMIHS